jgi:hypothetical protein
MELLSNFELRFYLYDDEQKFYIVQTLMLSREPWFSQLPITNEVFGIHVTDVPDVTNVTGLFLTSRCIMHSLSLTFLSGASASHQRRRVITASHDELKNCSDGDLRQTSSSDRGLGVPSDRALRSSPILSDPRLTITSSDARTISHFPSQAE